MDALEYLTNNYTKPAATVGSQTYNVPGLLMPQSADAFQASLSQYNAMMNNIAKSIVSSLGGNRVQGLGAPSSRVEQFDVPTVDNSGSGDGGVDSGTSEHGLLDGIATFGTNALGFMSPIGAVVSAISAMVNPNEESISKSAALDKAQSEIDAAALNEGMATDKGRQAALDAFNTEQEARSQFDNQTPEEGAPSISNDNTSDGGGNNNGGGIGGPNGDAGVGGQSTSDGSQGDTA